MYEWCVSPLPLSPAPPVLLCLFLFVFLSLSYLSLFPLISLIPVPSSCPLMSLPQPLHPASWDPTSQV